MSATTKRVLSVVVPVLALAAWSVATGQEPPAEVQDVADAMTEEPGGGVFRWIVLVLAVAAVGILAAVGRRFAATVTLLAGLVAVFLGERLFGDGAMHWPLTGLGLVAVVVSIGMRAQALLSETDPSRRSAQRIALGTTLVTLAALGAYGLSTEGGAALLGLTDTAADRWRGVWAALTPIILVSGLFPTLFVDRTLVANPVVLPAAAGNRAAIAGVSTAFALSLLFPLNYVAQADKYVWEADYSYFRVTGVGTATRAIVRGLPEPVAAYLYFPPGSDVRRKVEPYFDELAEASGGLLTVEVVDAAVRPDLAEAHAIRENGYVVLARGDVTQKFKIGTDLDRAKRELKKLDGTVQKNLLKLTSDAHVVYFLSGHGEASWRERENPARKLREFKSTLEDLNFKVEVLGVTEGSAVAVPDDAALVVVASPLVDILPEEEEALKRYLDDGGAMLLLLDPGANPMTGLLDHLGLTAGTAPIAHETAYVPSQRSIADRVLVATNRFGSHEAVTTVSRNSTRVGLVLPTVLALDTVDGSGRSVTTLVRSYPDSWEDVNGNRRKDADEPTGVFDLAVAVEPEGQDGFRAIVIGDVSVFSDIAYAFSQGNQWFAEDAAKWLVGEEEIVGETEREEDVEIRHTREGEGIWFWGTILGVPLLILVLGGITVNVRRAR